MSCCGRGARTPGGIARDSPGKPAGRRRADGPSRRFPAVRFQYVGTSVLTAYGPVSGRSYRFNTPGAVVAVDPRDQRSLEAVPKLRRVVGPAVPPRI